MVDGTVDPLVDAVLTLADGDDGLEEEAKYLVLAALESDDQITAALEAAFGDGEHGVVVPRQRPAAAPAEAARPVGAYLRSVTVTGFRGVGPTARLSLHPAAGLTVVAGRNGSGKSTFAEALEVALTGTSYRWRDRSAAWQRNWANLHAPQVRQVRVELAEEGAGTTTVGVDWKPDAAGPTDLRTWVQRPGARMADGVASLGWSDGIELFRPLLSYEELGGLLTAAPGKLYDELSKILGLERVVEAQARLDTRLAVISAPIKERKAALAELKPMLAAAVDERAAQALTLLRRRVPDLDALRHLVAGSTVDSAVDQLRATGRFVVPDAASVATAAVGLSGAVSDLTERIDAVAASGARRADLLRRALELVGDHDGDMICPVCGTGTLDATWRRSASRELEQETDEQERLGRAREHLQERRAAVARLFAATPRPDVIVDVGLLPSLARLRTALAAWHDRPDDDTGLVAHLQTAHTELAGALTAAQEEARAELARREDAWLPVATTVASYVAIADRAAAVETAVRQLEAACVWMRHHAELLRNQRLAPLADRAREIWAVLRQESNVDIRSITLPRPRGRNKQVEISAEVDGSAAGALGVMSTGELHALALALFLPRATRPESPMRFIVLDDPIQAMDPSKIDGFVDVLRELATTRQVVVFSHDDRLPEAVRRLDRNARILEVWRTRGSQVSVVEAHDPAGRDLSDAFALCADPGVPPEVVGRIVPQLCRSAFETAARDAYFGRALSVGLDRDTVETTWNTAANQPQRLALALYRDADRSADAWLRARPWRRPALDTCGRGVHRDFRTHPRELVRDVERLVTDVKAAP